ncbi:hypothetical protein CTO_0963 [Chlamydia trachomatis A2497]|uniref:Uncharacterized protein n=1 Tax=Chlamydia trachomatis serovar A (strain A2497) TaxID=580047 RepID=G4NP83_CHLT4|nr:hypothetical protein CTO_0963 [Chlamydia trachomatis A2497]
MCKEGLSPKDGKKKFLFSPPPPIKQKYFTLPKKQHLSIVGYQKLPPF